MIVLLRYAGLLACLLLSIAAPAALPQEVKLSGHPNWPPYSWQHGQRIIGLGPELAEIVFRDIGIAVKAQVHGNWKRVQLGAESGVIDAVAGIYVTEARKQYLAYPAQAFIDDANVLWVAKGRGFAYQQWADLIGKRGTAMQGESYGQDFDQFIKDKLNFEWVNTPAQALKKVDSGHSDFYPFSLYGGQIQVQQLGFASRVEALPKAISTEGVYIAISRKSPYLNRLPELEKALARRQADGTVDKLLKKYIELASKLPAPAS